MPGRCCDKAAGHKSKAAIAMSKKLTRQATRAAKKKAFREAMKHVRAGTLPHPKQHHAADKAPGDCKCHKKIPLVWHDINVKPAHVTPKKP